jgi:hypothetical protein
MDDKQGENEIAQSCCFRDADEIKVFSAAGQALQRQTAQSGLDLDKEEKLTFS